MSNEFFVDEYTSVLQKLVQEVVNDPATYLGSKYLPSVAMPVSKIRTEVLEASGGVTQEYVRGTEPKYIQNFGSRVQEYKNPAYREKMLFDEEDIINLRELGQKDPSKRGIRQYIDKGIDRLNRRIEARIELERWNTIFNGGFSYMGLTFSYGVPSQNRVVPLGALWSTDGINANNSANPIADIRYWVQGGYAPFRKYKIKTLVLSPNTARWILENANTKSYLASLGANPNIGEWSIDKVIGFLIPAGPNVVIYEGWYQQETIVNSKITVGDAIYFIPDGMIFFEATLPNADIIGEFVQGLHLATGTVDSPGYGKYLVVEENIAPGTKGGPGNPYIDILGGVSGGVKLDRPFDLLTGKVVA